MECLRIIAKPGKGEYPDYSSIYIDLIQDDGRVLDLLKTNLEKIRQFIYSLPTQSLYHSYQSGKWTIKEILVHLIDDERIFCYRALRFARFDSTELPGFDQDSFALHSGANARSLESIFEEYETVRQSTIAMFNNFSDDALLRSGISDGSKRTVRALLYHIAGHELRHIKIIKERYLNLSVDRDIL